MQNKINIGIIGKNFGYNVIYKSIIKNNQFNVTAFSFKSKKSEKIKLPKKIRIYSNWKKLILNKKIKAIVIATPPKFHKEIIKFAIKNNKNVFCEKPFTRSFNEASYIYNLAKEKDNLLHMVNYEFMNIRAFSFFKKKILNKIKINKIYLNWFINIKKRSKKNWKEIHSQGGGIMFNYVCHSIYYLEFLFGKIKSIKTTTILNKNENVKKLKTKIIFKNMLTARIDIKVGSIGKIKPIHQLRMICDKKDYVLETELNSLSDKFKLIEINNNSIKKNNKILFEDKKNKNDFRLEPTHHNLSSFYRGIAKNKIQGPNFFSARRVHLIINKIVKSAQNKSEMYVN